MMTAWRPLLRSTPEICKFRRDLHPRGSRQTPLPRPRFIRAPPLPGPTGLPRFRDVGRFRLSRHEVLEVYIRHGGPAWDRVSQEGTARDETMSWQDRAGSGHPGDGPEARKLLGRASRGRILGAGRFPLEYTLRSGCLDELDSPLVLIHAWIRFPVRERRRGGRMPGVRDSAQVFGELPEPGGLVFAAGVCARGDGPAVFPIGTARSFHRRIRGQEHDGLGSPVRADAAPVPEHDIWHLSERPFGCIY